MCECDVANYGHNDRFVHLICVLWWIKNGKILSDKDKEHQQQVEMCQFSYFSAVAAALLWHRNIYRWIYQFVESISKYCNWVHQLRVDNNNNGI